MWNFLLTQSVLLFFVELKHIVLKVQKNYNNNNVKLIENSHDDNTYSCLRNVKSKYFCHMWTIHLANVVFKTAPYV